MNGINTDRVLKFLGNVLIFIFVSQLLLLPEFIRDIVHINTGFKLWPLRLYVIGLPGLYVMYLCYKERRLRAPHLVAFLLLFFGFIIIERMSLHDAPATFSFIDIIPFAGKLFPGHKTSYSFPAEQIYFYIYFLVLANYGLTKDRFYRVIDYAFYSGLAFCIVTYLGYFGLFDLSYRGTNYQGQSVGFCARPVFVIYLQQMTYMFAFTLLLLIIKQLKEKRFSGAYVLRDLTFILLLFTMLVLNAGRGPFILGLFLVACYCVLLWVSGKAIGKMAASVLAAIFIAAGIASSVYTPCPKQKENPEGHVRIYARFFKQTNPDEARTMEILNTLENIKKYPLRGVGFTKAAKKTEEKAADMSKAEKVAKKKPPWQPKKSNNQFLQIFASHGLFYFFVYLFYNYRLLLCRASLIWRPEVLLSLLFQVGFLMLMSPFTLALFSISGYVALYFYTAGKERGEGET